MLAFFHADLPRKENRLSASLISGGILCVFEWLMFFLGSLCRNVPGEIFQWNFGFAGGDQLRLGKRKRGHLDLFHALMSSAIKPTLNALANGEEKPLVLA
jgi:hypothetical protein